ncbi:zinc finger homeobox protein 4-like [Centroberyx affinis]|uniref:zinc finger homeobox protein 4-like n=1 Tax=Centroberyx affinis TaxID=166261 RepID=UPI003A5BF8BC
MLIAVSAGPAPPRPGDPPRTAKKHRRKGKKHRRVPAEESRSDDLCDLLTPEEAPPPSLPQSPPPHTPPLPPLPPSQPW